MALQDDQPLAVGRATWTASDVALKMLKRAKVGQLRGPSTICVDAVLETNLEAVERVLP